MERIFEQNLLYDFYGELLTPHQQKVYEDAVYNDMSLSEIAEEYGISRQGVHDLLKRCDKLLQGYESKLHLVEKFMGAKEKIRQIDELTRVECEPGEESVEKVVMSHEMSKMAEELTVAQRMQRIRVLSRELMKEW